MYTHKVRWYSAIAIAVLLLISGCSMGEPVKKPEIGPAGTAVEAPPNPPILQRFESPPVELYDLEATAGVIFEGINKAKWPQAEAGLSTLKTVWPQTKDLVGDKKGAKDADEALGKLSTAIQEKEVSAAYESLNKFMGSVGEIGKSYKLSPLSDLIGVDNAVRNVSYYVEENDWSKAAIKVKELEGTWNQAKPSLEKVGVMGQITRTHSLVNQLKDAVAAQSKGAIEGQLTSINASMGTLRDFYRGK